MDEEPVAEPSSSKNKDEKNNKNEKKDQGGMEWHDLLETNNSGSSIRSECTDAACMASPTPDANASKDKDINEILEKEKEDSKKKDEENKKKLEDDEKPTKEEEKVTEMVPKEDDKEASDEEHGNKGGECTDAACSAAYEKEDKAMENTSDVKNDADDEDKKGHETGDSAKNTKNKNKDKKIVEKYNPKEGEDGQKPNWLPNKYAEDKDIKPSDKAEAKEEGKEDMKPCLLYTSPSPRDQRGSRMPSSA